ncbi:MAG: insulinase family protein, partial [Planctomycetota bacterium]|nr:insulinase family protein [Planctomycetota bacterium]
MRRPLQQLHAKRSAHDPEFASSRAITDKAIPGHPLSFHALAILGLTCITASALQAPAHAAPAHAIPAHAISVSASPAPTAAAPAATVLAAVALGVPVPAAPASATAVPVAAAHAAPTPAAPGPALQDDLPASPAELALPPLRPHQPKRPAPIVLNCGARLLLIEDDSLPLVDGTLLFPGGSVHEDERQSGLTAILAETLRQGGSKTLSGAELDTWLDRHAVELSIAADAEFLRIQFSCLAEDLGETLAVIGDLLARPAYPEEDLERVRLQYLTALARRADDADSLASEVIEMLAFGSDSPWARQPTPESLAAVDRESLVRFHRLHIAKNRAILGLSGSLALALAVGANGEAAGAGESAAPGTPNAPDKSDGRVNQPAGSDGSAGSGGSDGSDGSDDFKGPNGSKGSNNPNGSKDSSGPNAPRVSKATPGNPTAAPAIPGTPSAANESAAADENSHQPSQALLDLLDATLAPLPEAQGELPSPPRPFSQPRLTRVHILDRPGVPQTELRLAAP